MKNSQLSEENYLRAFVMFGLVRDGFEDISFGSPISNPAFSIPSNSSPVVSVVFSLSFSAPPCSDIVIFRLNSSVQFLVDRRKLIVVFII